MMSGCVQHLLEIFYNMIQSCISINRMGLQMGSCVILGTYPLLRCSWKETKTSRFTNNSSVIFKEISLCLIYLAVQSSNKQITSKVSNDVKTQAPQRTKKNKTNWK